MISVREVMTKDPITLSKDASAVEAAKAMRESDVGAIIVVDGDIISGIVTDRDIVVRAVADDRDLNTTTVGEISSGEEIATLKPTDTADDAVKLMKEKAVRRLPVVESGQPVGIVSLGDLAEVKDPDSALGRISTAPANQ